MTVLLESLNTRSTDNEERQVRKYWIRTRVWTQEQDYSMDTRAELKCGYQSRTEVWTLKKDFSVHTGTKPECGHRSRTKVWPPKQDWSVHTGAGLEHGQRAGRRRHRTVRQRDR